MIPGGRVNERQMRIMMKRLGMTTEPLEEVEEVLIRTKDKEHRLRSPEVTILTVQGVRTYQVVGEAEIRSRSPDSPAMADAVPGASVAPAAVEPPDEDVRLVMDQAGVSRAEAIRALEDAGGAPAEAILALLSRRDGGDR